MPNTPTICCSRLCQCPQYLSPLVPHSSSHPPSSLPSPLPHSLLPRPQTAANIDATSTLPGPHGVVAKRWHGPPGTPPGGQFALDPLPITRLEFPRGTRGATVPATGAPYFLHYDVYYMVVGGRATFGGSTGSGNATFAYGDLFWVGAGTPHGPILNAGDDPLTVLVAGTRFEPVLLGEAPSAPNPSIHPTWLPQRAYRQADGGNFSANPSPHSDECMANGGVWNMGFGATLNTPAVLRVKWHANCSIPYHYHPTGAVYFVQCKRGRACAHARMCVWERE